MSFNSKFTIFSLAVLFAVPYFGWKHYTNSRPEPKPDIVSREEITLTILPGWNLRDVAEYLVKKKVVSSTADVFMVTGLPATPFSLPKKPVDPKESFTKFPYYNYEGYLAPETIRFFKGSTAKDVIERFYKQHLDEITDEMRSEAIRRNLTWHEVLTMASIIEREARGEEDRKMVSDILWRRLGIGMALQVDSSVHYFAARTGDVFTTKEEREHDNAWNTYKYRGLPPGPISMPSLQSIDAALFPKRNTYWYFLTGTNGGMYYAVDLDQHNVNRYKYIR